MRRQPNNVERAVEYVRDEFPGTTIPLRRIVCPCCDGRGHYVNPSIDGNGLSWEDIDNLGGDDFMTDYLGGAYDIPCEECHGANVVDDIDRSNAPEEVIEAWDEWFHGEAEYRAEREAERRAGC